MSFDEPQKNKMMTGAPAKKEYHFAATAEHLSEVVYAATIQEAEATYLKVRRLINSPVEQSTPADTKEQGEDAVQ